MAPPPSNYLFQKGPGQRQTEIYKKEKKRTLVNVPKVKKSPKLTSKCPSSRI